MIETHLLADSGIVCRPSGSLDWIAAVSLRHAVGHSIQPGVDVIVDLSRVEFIDAVGISALVGTVRRVRALGGQANICGASPGRYAGAGAGRRLPTGDGLLGKERQ